MGRPLSRRRVACAMAFPPHHAASPANPAVLALSGVAGIAIGGAVLLVAYGGFQGWFATEPRAAVERKAPPPPAKPVAAAPVRPPPPPVPKSGEASARRAPNGHFYFDTAVNGVTARMMFDTGASYVALRWEDAGRLGIPVSSLEFTGRVLTANGSTEVAPVMLDTVRIGDIVRRNVPALVSRPGKLNVNLLGQTFMSRLKGYRFEGNELVLQGG